MKEIEMKKQLNQLKMGTILSYVSIAVQNLIAMLYTPVMLRLLGQNEYGLYQLGNSTVAYLGVLTFGFGSSYVRFYYQYKVNNQQEEIKKLNSIFLLVFGALAVVCLVAGAGMVSAADVLFDSSLSASDLQQVRVLMIILIITMALTFPNVIFDCYITAHEKYIFQRMLLIAVTVLNPFIALPLLLMGYRSMSLVLANLILSVLRVGLNIYYCVKKLDMRFQFHGLEWQVLKNVGIFSFYIFLNEIANQINWNVDKMILGAVQGAEIVAIYSVGSQFNQYFINMSTAVSNVFIPRVNKMVAEKQSNRKLTDLFIKIGRVQYIILAGVLVGYLLYGKFFIRKWAGEGYDVSYYVGALIMIPTLIPLIQNIGIEIQRAENKHKFRSVAYFAIAIANGIISIPLAQNYGAVGAAFGTCIATVVGNVLLMNWYYQFQIGLNIPRFFLSMVRPTLALAAAGMAGLLVKRFFPVESWGAFLSQGIFFLAVYFAGLYIWGFNQDEKKEVQHIQNRFSLKKKNQDS